MNQKDIRWKQRFENLQSAFKYFKQAVQLNFAKPDDLMLQMALIKSFEMTFELSWKTIKDYLSYTGFDVNSPRETIKQAFANGIIEDGQLWITMLDERNLMIHTYDEEKAKQAVTQICYQYLTGIEQLQQFFLKNLA